MTISTRRKMAKLNVEDVRQVSRCLKIDKIAELILVTRVSDFKPFSPRNVLMVLNVQINKKYQFKRSRIFTRIEQK